MSIFSNFFKSSGSSSDIAKNRLKVAITSDRAVCSPELMDQMTVKRTLMLLPKRLPKD